MAVLLKAHLPCEWCESSDAMSIYQREDETTYAICYSCNHKEDMEEVEKPTKKTEDKPLTLGKDYSEGSFKSIAERDISKEACERYGVKVVDNDVLFPYFEGTDIVGFKVRNRHEKKFYVDGQIRSAGLFGSHVFPKGGKFLTITEGEYDALAAFQLTGSKWPVVSIKNGAAAALRDCQAAFEYIDSFEQVVICFDNDKAGQDAAKQVADLIGAKAKVFKSAKYKDANDYLTDGAVEQFVNDWWRSERYVPDGIVDGASLWELVNQPVEKAAVLYPFEGLNKLTYGLRFGELVTVTAGSGLGKSQFLREIAYHILLNTQENLGLMFLEEDTKKTAKSLMSLAANVPLHLPDTEVSKEELRRCFDETLGTGRIYLFDHFGSTSVDNIVNRVRYLAKGLNCRFIVLDHISIVVSAQASGDERKALDEIMTKLRMLVQETGISLLIVSHLKRPDGKGHEEGAATSLAQLRGSGSIAQLSDIVIGLERDGQADDETERNTTSIRVLKNRFSGLTGPAGCAVYSRETGRMLDRVEPTL